MDLSDKAKGIIAQAPNWNFQGDCSLLQWMQEISQQLEVRAKKTNESLNKLNTDVKRSAIALDNAANSLTALQYTQFVENRCHEDDETTSSKTSTEKVADTKNSATDVLKSFLQKNVEVLQHCHEKYALEFDDSDEEEAENNYIYQPKNPYNERLLPHIYGSKLWKENWHVGLCEDNNDYSGDEASDNFSESSSSTPEARESYASNSPAMSEWTSSNSISTDKYVVASAKNILTPQKIVGQANVFPTTSNAEDLFTSLQSIPCPVPPAASKSADTRPIVSREARLVNDQVSKVVQAEPETSKTVPSMSQIKQKAVNLFEDSDFKSLMSEIVDKAQTKMEAPPVPAIRKLSTSKVMEIPVHSQMSPPIDKLHEEVPRTVVKSQPLPTPQNSLKSKSINLFDSPAGSPEHVDSLFAPITASATTTQITTPSKFSAKNLFDDDDDDDDDFLNVFGGIEKSQKPQATGKTQLFDRDDDDTNIFGTADATKTVTADKTRSINFFDVEPPPLDEVRALPIKNNVKIAANVNKENEKRNLFSDKEEEDEEDLLFSPKNIPHKIQQKYSSLKQNIFGGDEEEEELKHDKILSSTTALQANLFEEAKDEIVQSEKAISPIHSTMVTSKTNLLEQGSEKEKENKNISAATTRNVTNSKINLFGETPEEEEDDLFKTIVTNKEVSKPAEKSKTEKEAQEEEEIIQKPLTPIFPATATISKVNLFEDEDENDPLDELFKQDVEKNKQVLETNNPETKNLKIAEEEIVARMTENVEEESSSSVEKVSDLNKDEITRTTSEADKIQAATTTKVESETPITRKYTSIFSDEPPDDDDFFATPGDTINSPLKLDDGADEDVFEASPTLVNKNTAKPDYDGLCLFSDVPPDDNFQEEAGSVSTKRLQGIFYDDFNETRQAVNKSFEKSTYEQEPSFTNQPPLDETKDVTDKATPTQRDMPPISKLQRPQIKINVQTLLPNAGGMSNIRKSIEQKQQQQQQQQEQENIEHEPAALISDKQPTIKANEHTLTHVCKERVRAPANRRPSTRRARHENYHQSLRQAAAAEQKEEEEEEKIVELAKRSKNMAVEEAPKPVIFPFNEEQTKLPSIQTQTGKKPDFNNLFADDDDDDDLFFKAAKNIPKTAPIPAANVASTAIPSTSGLTGVSIKTKSSAKLFDDSNGSDDDFNNSHFTQTTPKTSEPQLKKTLAEMKAPTQQQQLAPAHKSLFLDEQSDSDDDLFKSAKPKPKITTSAAKTQTTIQAASTQKLATLFGSDEQNDEDDDHFLSALKRSTAVPKSTTVSGLNHSLFDDEGSDDDLFSSTKTTTQKPLHKPTPNTMQDSKVKKQSIMTDNPLADLL